MPLTDLAIRNAKPRVKAYKLADGAGLYCEILPSGTKSFRLKYRIDGKEKRLVIGSYPTVTLQDAREAMLRAKRLIQGGEDPSQAKKLAKAARLEAASNSFEAVAEEWWKKQKASGKWSDAHAARVWARIEKNLNPWIGKKPVSEIKAKDILDTLRKVEKRGSLYMAESVKQSAGQVMRYAIACGVAEVDPVPSLQGALTPHVEKHMAAITDPKQVGAVLRAFDEFKGSHQVAIALKLAPMVFVRPGELRKMKWADLDLDSGVWEIPATVMKMREPHLVPLSKQAVTILREMQPFSGHLEYVFPGGRDPKRPMSDAAINAALRRLGIDTRHEHTGHGFRAMARTILHEQLDYAPEVIEAQLAHKVAGPLGAAYARAKFIEKRKEMMQEWANYLDRLKSEGAVV